MGQGLLPLSSPHMLHGSAPCGDIPRQLGSKESIQLAPVLPVQAQRSQGERTGLTVDLELHASAQGMPVATLPLTLTPGAPHRVQLMPGHPWEGKVGCSA